jgi:hypothetical protein
MKEECREREGPSANLAEHEIANQLVRESCDPLRSSLWDGPIIIDPNPALRTGRPSTSYRATVTESLRDILPSFHFSQSRDEKSSISNTPGWMRTLIGVAMVAKTFPSTCIGTSAQRRTALRQRRVWTGASASSPRRQALR